jgi:CRISPR system Cascade subunit CasD
MRTILLKFSGPLQSWGTASHFESRHTDLYPSKSAVIGMIAAALGYRRSEDEKIRRLNQLHFAVRADQEGKITEDYQTAHQYKYSCIWGDVRARLRRTAFLM